jgi:hypothetical protein
MARLWKRHQRLWWSLTLALIIVLLPSKQADAQMIGYGMGYPVAGWGGYGYGYPGLMGYGYAPYGFGGYGYGFANPGFGYGYPGFGYGAGYGYPGFGYGYGYPYPGLGFAPGYAGYYGTAFDNPLFGIGQTPLGTQSFFMESRLLGRVPRPSTPYYYRSAYNRPTVYRGY